MFFTGLLVEAGVDPVPPAQGPSPFADAVAAVAGAASAVVLAVAGHRQGVAVAGGERGQRRPAAVAGLAPLAVQHEFPLTRGAAGLGIFASCPFWHLVKETCS